jgi:hypothetical protein
LESKHSSHAVSNPSRIITTRERRGLARVLMKMNPRFQYPVVVMVMVVYGGGCLFMKAGVGAAMTRVELIGMVIGQVVVTVAEAQEAMGRRDAQKTVTRTVVTAVVVVVTVTVVEVHHVMKVAPETALVLMIAPVVAAVPPMIEWVVDLAALVALFLVTLH